VRRRRPPQPVLWHPDDFRLEVDRRSGVVLAAQGALPVGVPAEDVVGRPVADLLLSPRVAVLLGHVGRRGAPGATFRALWRGQDGTVGRSETVAQVVGHQVVLHGRDVTSAHHERDRLARRATTDPLTGLPNRAVLEQSLRTAAARSARSGLAWGVAVLDLDGFKALNDQAGHAAGDRVLVAVAAALQDEVRAADDVLRLGGDELVVVLRDLAEPDLARQVAHRLVAAVRRACAGAVTASVGVAVGVGADHPHALLDAADAAMYEAKRAGGDTVSLVGPSRQPG
jgi:diguanylate cyclase (GGDEF)-like protein